VAGDPVNLGHRGSVRVLMPRLCRGCNRMFPPRNSNQWYCVRACHIEHKNRERKKVLAARGLTLKTS
jgi:hypothetical protein